MSAKTHQRWFQTAAERDAYVDGLAAGMQVTSQGHAAPPMVVQDSYDGGAERPHGAFIEIGKWRPDGLIDWD
jgi:hypothetical protein